MKKQLTDITEMVKRFRPYESSLRAVTKEELGSDMVYRQLFTTPSQAIKFNYHNDYWGYADEYQEMNVEFVEAMKPYIRKNVILDGQTIKIVGVLIDKQYNALSHTRILAELI